ncbi:MAG: hypothetical protein P8Z67_12170, partial [Gammaproteobacteria bacterium]
MRFLIAIRRNHGYVHKVTVKSELEHRGWAAVLLALMPWLILFLFFYWMYKRTANALGGRLG